ncbi:MAG: hypothetical protein AB1779_10725 [Candidatus Thermoplasmatota archaeon]
MMILMNKKIRKKDKELIDELRALRMEIRELSENIEALLEILIVENEEFADWKFSHNELPMGKRGIGM